MKQSDIGPFGVVTLVLVLLGQVAALAGLFARGWAWGAAAAVLAGLVSRAALTLACRAGVPPPVRRASARRWPARCPAARRRP